MSTKKNESSSVAELNVPRSTAAAVAGGGGSARDRIALALQSGRTPLPAPVANGIASLASRMASDDVLLQRLRVIVAAEQLAVTAVIPPPSVAATVADTVAMEPLSPTMSSGWHVVDSQHQIDHAAIAEARFIGVDGEGDAESASMSWKEDTAVAELREIFQSGPFVRTSSPSGSSPCAPAAAAAAQPCVVGEPGPSRTTPPPAAAGAPAVANCGTGRQTRVNLTAAFDSRDSGSRSHNRTRSSGDAAGGGSSAVNLTADEDPVFSVARRVADGDMSPLGYGGGQLLGAGVGESGELGNAISALWSAIMGTFFDDTAAAPPPESGLLHSTAEPPLLEPVTSPARRGAASSPEARKPPTLSPVRHADHGIASSDANAVRASMAAAAVHAALSRSASALSVDEAGNAAPAGTSQQQQHGDSANQQQAASEHFLIAAALLVNSTLLWFVLNRHGAQSGDPNAASRLDGDGGLSRVVSRVASVLQASFFSSTSGTPSPSP